MSPKRIIIGTLLVPLVALTNYISKQTHLQCQKDLSTARV